MKIKILALGKITQNSPEGLLCFEYVKRIKFSLETKQFTNGLLQGGFSQELSKSLAKKELIICLDAEGKEFTSENFADFLQKTSSNSRNITFLIGGDEGFSKEVKSCSDFLLSLGKMTFPHKIARILLYEQLYRAQTILENHPYHK